MPPHQNNEIKQAEEGDLQQELILEAARNRGICITDISDQMLCKAALLELDGQVELLVKGIFSNSINLKTKYFCDFKQLTKHVFERLKIPSPKSLVFFGLDQPELKDFISTGRKYVCKPQVGTNGVGVELGITSFQEVCDYWERHKNIGNSFLIEEQVDGEDLRIQVIGGRIAASCIRIPAYVIGDSLHTLIQLIELRRKVIHKQCPSDSLELDRTSFALIKKQNLSLESVPEEGRHVQLKEVSNIAQGGIAIDVSHEIHPGYEDWVRQIVKFCDASYFALDVICHDHTKHPNTNAVALELNSQAEWTHHTFSERRTHDIGKLVIDITFGTSTPSSNK